MQFTAKDIAFMLNGTVEGDPLVAVSRLAKIEEGSNGALSFLANPKYEQYLYTTQASVVIVNNDLQLTAPVKATLVRVENAYTSFSLLLEKYNTIKLNKTGIEEPSFIHKSAKIGKDPYIGAFTYISQDVVIGDNCRIYPGCYIADNVKLGNNVTLFPGVKVYFDCVIGNNVVIHSGAIVGSDGFGFAPNADGSYTKVAQIGNVIIEDNVEVGANTTLDRATMGSTYIRKGAKIDNLVQIAHNVDIGQNTVIAAQAGIAGSTKLGESVMLGGQVGVVGHISLAKGTKVQAQSGVGRTIKEEGKSWAGSPAIAYAADMRSNVVVSRLPELERRVNELEKIIKELKNRDVH
ncbi:UDP-3-O-(3-hydroxymyristoyl)glucosamine N-acyltransferase [Mucilaginibacter phyllosphaerae]|uniref:UDP-3-O-acylglucosamine N-acyltransferase n=1 Tax=Mucilaginibacter phyllosphaerae TaxID=1812349 RepID=A0A4Y8AEU4_9SPHI|nr:UDP-3-O-(3-hydroxymyristoyl)glucosamine N-acyltransferase [Mucilaginibacter phyllosphaerae]MBB3970185.1 UDP-3-O-[3-hydroxymyristoyl] glucosamine N-acyltransferase [Mucilaginibacter phyllosphaerae]TEW66569.1 UDP-3-O-(3-hydroxymyristoyl)glucosamine N-acyltransferase [Mucilaginibacter phyllosphaerae]GGH10384.1 UDP-3-O-acylglucosamine N-acyltransferase [Mucilaginibacter phyllosphaerae]